MVDAESRPSVLVTGAAGYVGTHLSRYLRARRWRVIGIDSFLRPLSFAKRDVIAMDVADTAALETLLRREAVSHVIHLAALTFPAESLLDPYSYYATNVAGTLSLLRAIRNVSVSRLVFASSCAIYGVTTDDYVNESHAASPCSPYGRSKLMSEQMIIDGAVASASFDAVILRLFNVAGGDSGSFVPGTRCAATRLIPSAIRAARDSSSVFGIHGVDWPTPDGTCVRDYVHIEDVCAAFERSLVIPRSGSCPILNIGSGVGTSIRNVIQAVERATESQIATAVREASPGDPPAIVASVDAARRVLQWSPGQSALAEIVQSALAESGA